MKPQELRIGNEVADLTGGTCIVRGITSKGIWIKDNGGPASKENFKPIPITPEWLEEKGFEKKAPYSWKGNGADWQPDNVITEYQDYVKDAGDEDYFFIRYEKWSHRKKEDSEWEVELSMSIHKGSWYEKASDSIPTSYTVEYRHQLQNLYFDLTGKEL